MVFPVIGGDGKPTGYEIDNSLRFNNDDSAYMQYTPSSASSSRTKWTWSGWIKRGHEAVDENNDYHRFFCVDADINNYIITGFNISGAFNVTARNSNTQVLKFETGAGQFRDHSAWYHIVMAYDSTQSTARNRFRVYFNGVEDTRALDTTPSENLELTVLNTSEHNIGRDNHSGTTYYYDGYMSEVHFVDGTQYAASDFGEFNDNGVWIPKEADVTYGTNGFKLEFKQTGTSANSSGMGADTSGNDNHFTPTNLAATDVTVDTPTNNFCTLNPLDPVQGAAYSEGNCKVVTNSSNRNYVTGTFGLTSGKWYWEAKLTAVTSNADNQAFFGIADLDDRGTNSTGQSLGDRANEVGWHQEEGKFQRNNSFSDGSTAGDSAAWGIGDICAIALDADNNRVTIAKNGSWADGSGNADESNPTSFVTYTASTMTPAMGEGGGGTEATWECNFGNPVFSISSGNADANGYGNFEYAVPSGYYALCTKNLAEYG